MSTLAAGRPRLSLPLALTISLLAPAAALPQDAPPLHEVLRRAGEYVVGYETGFALVVAEERYVQA